MKSERPLNALETIFASCNVRFAILVAFEDGDNLELEALQTSTHAALQASVLGRLALIQNAVQPQGESEYWSLTAAEGVVAETKVRGSIVGLSSSSLVKKDNVYDRILHTLVHQETMPAEGPLLVQIFKDPSSSSRAAGLFVNSNHAIVDGRSLTHLIELATACSEPATESYAGIMQDWRDLVGQSDNVNLNDDPPFLLSQHKILTMKELCDEHISAGNDCLSFELSGPTITNLKRSFNKKPTYCHKISFSGYLAAVILHSLAQEYHGAEKRDLAISVLVDLRPYIKMKKGQGEIPQLHGSVNVIECTDRLQFHSHGGYAVPAAGDKLASHILELSYNLTEQLRRRVKRGEAHRNAMALTSGNFDQGGPPSTVELSNLGVCKLRHGAKLYTSQRFDGYDGVSCMVHSESSTGCMRWNVAVGQGLDAPMIQRVFSRAHSICVDMAQLT